MVESNSSSGPFLIGQREGGEERERGGRESSEDLWSVLREGEGRGRDDVAAAAILAVAAAASAQRVVVEGRGLHGSTAAALPFSCHCVSQAGGSRVSRLEDGGHCCGTAAQWGERGERAAERPRSRSQLGGQSRVTGERLSPVTWA